MYTTLLHESCPLQVEAIPRVEDLDEQCEILSEHRETLLDFLTDAHATFGLQPNTLFLCVNTLDRYLSRRAVYLKDYQLGGCVCLFIAAIYNEKDDDVPTIQD